MASSNNLNRRVRKLERYADGEGPVPFPFIFLSDLKAEGIPSCDDDVRVAIGDGWSLERRASEPFSEFQARCLARADLPL